MIRVPTAGELRSRAKTFWARSLTNKLVVICTVIFIAQSLGLFFASALMLNLTWVKEGFLLNFLSHGFLHGNLWHWVLNGLALYFAGNAIERYDSGKIVLGTFLGGIACGGIVWFLCVVGIAVNPASHTLVGASAGIAALFAYFSIYNRRSEIQAAVFFVLPLRMKAWVIFAALAGISLFFFVVSEVPMLRTPGVGMQSVAHSAHLGGLLFGAGIALFFDRMRSRIGNIHYFRR